MIIPLGYHCNISFLNQNLRIKKETSIFEWFESYSFFKYISFRRHCSSVWQNFLG